MGFLDKLQAKLELYRLEQRYTRRKKRTTFISHAAYVDGEYVYPSSFHSSEATSPTSLSKNSTGSLEKEFWATAGTENNRSPTSEEFGQRPERFGNTTTVTSSGNQNPWS